MTYPLPLFSPVLVGEFLKTVEANQDGTSVVRWYRTLSISSFSTSGKEILFRVGGGQESPDLCAGRLASEEQAQKELFDLLTLISPKEDAEDEGE